MTLVVGIKCSDGVAIGADSALSETGPRGEIVFQTPGNAKVHVESNQIVFAGTGDTAMLNRCQSVFGALQRNHVKTMHPAEIGKLASRRLIDNLNETHAAQLGAQFALALATESHGASTTLITISFNPQNPYQAVVHENKNFWTAMGSGLAVARPFIYLCQRAFWNDEPPSLQDGVFSLAFVLKLSCEMSPGGVSAPFHITTLSERKEGGGVDVHQLQEDELNEHDEAVDRAIHGLGLLGLRVAQGAGVGEELVQYSPDEQA